MPSAPLPAPSLHRGRRRLGGHECGVAGLHRGVVTSYRGRPSAGRPLRSSTVRSPLPARRAWSGVRFQRSLHRGVVTSAIRSAPSIPRFPLGGGDERVGQFLRLVHHHVVSAGEPDEPPSSTNTVIYVDAQAVRAGILSWQGGREAETKCSTNNRRQPRLYFCKRDLRYLILLRQCLAADGERGHLRPCSHLAFSPSESFRLRASTSIFRGWPTRSSA